MKLMRQMDAWMEGIDETMCEWRNEPLVNQWVILRLHCFDRLLNEPFMRESNNCCSHYIRLLASFTLCFIIIQQFVNFIRSRMIDCFLFVANYWFFVCIKWSINQWHFTRLFFPFLCSTNRLFFFFPKFIIIFYWMFIFFLKLI